MQSQTLVGHHEQIKVFLSRCEKNTLPHAWLLTGPQGIGKGLFAYHAAWFLLQSKNSETPNFQSLSMDDTTFRKMRSGSHPDFLFVKPGNGEGASKNTITVDQIRKVDDFVRSTPAVASHKVIIIDPADAMNINASNALLKVLEEPSPGVVFFLVSHSPKSLLATVRSRCCVLKFNPLSMTELGEAFSKPQNLIIQAFSQGRPGLLMATEKHQGESLLEMILIAFRGLKSSDMTGAHMLAKHVSKLDPEAKEYFYDLFIWFLGELVMAYVFPQKTLEEAHHMSMLESLIDQNNYYGILKARGKILDLFLTQDQLNLDPRHVLINSFLILKDAFIIKS